jgi:hypothetical protein
MMEDETRQLLIGLFRELKKYLNDVKMDISAVTAGQEELKNNIENSISAVKDEISAVKNDIENSIGAVRGNISALETKINADQEELRQEISDFQERIRAGQADFEERLTCTVDTQLKNVSSMVEQQTRKRPFGRPRCRWEDGIRMDLREIGLGGDWIRLAQDGPVTGCCECGDEPSGSCATELVRLKTASKERLNHALLTKSSGRFRMQ